MATLYPWSSVTDQRLATAPDPGTTHRWLAQVAAGLARSLPADKCRAYLRRCCDELVDHRPIPDREIDDAVAFAYGPQSTRPRTRWPDARPDVVARVVQETEAVFGLEPKKQISWDEALAWLFTPQDVICCGWETFHQTSGQLLSIRDGEPVSGRFQFVVANPMANLGPRCRANVRTRYHIVAEFDDPDLDKPAQARLISRLARCAKLRCVVDSGGKSLHAWFDARRMDPEAQHRFFWLACILGADPTRWDIAGWVRMPGGTRRMPDGTTKPQPVLYLEP